jgi:hypothetical protein
MHKADLPTLERGLFSRVFVSKYGRSDGGLAPPIVPGMARVQELFAPFKKALRKVSFGLTPMSHVEYVESRGRKKRIYEAAYERYVRNGITPWDWQLDTFVKAEKLNITKKPDPDPRVIQPRSAAYNIVVGSYIHPLERVLYKHIARLFGSPTIMKGMNADQMGRVVHRKWTRFSDPVAVGFDVNRMDQHVSIPLLKAEHSCYNMYIHDREVRYLLRKQLKNKGRARLWDGTLKYNVDGRRASGDVNTGIGNCIIMCALVYNTKQTIDLELLNNGDDCVVIIERRDLRQFLHIMNTVLTAARLPTTFEEPVDELEKLVFCQMSPVFDGTNWVMVRDPRTCLDKDACTIKPVTSARTWNTLRNSVGLSGLAAYGNMPVLSAFYECLRRGAGERVDKDSVIDGLKRMSAGMKKQGLGITPECRASFARAFDITPNEQIAIEEHYSAIRPEWAEPRALRKSDYEGVVGSLMGCVC